MKQVRRILERKIKQLNARHGTNELDDLIWETNLFLCETPELTPIVASLYNDHKISQHFAIDIVNAFSAKRVGIMAFDRLSGNQSTRKSDLFPDFVYQIQGGLTIIKKVIEIHKEAHEYHKSALGTPLEKTIERAGATEVGTRRRSLLKLCNDIIDEIDLIDGRNEKVNAVKKLPGDPFLFYLSREKGLYRMFRDDEKPYPIHRAKDRFRILNNLKNHYTSTKEISEILRKPPQAIRAQIAGIRREIGDHFDGIRGMDFIVGEQKRGYKIGERITLVNKG